MTQLVVYTRTRQIRVGTRLKLAGAGLDMISLSRALHTPSVMADLMADPHVTAIYGPYELTDVPSTVQALSPDKRLWNR